MRLIAPSKHNPRKQNVQYETLRNLRYRYSWYRYRTRDIRYQQSIKIGYSMSLAIQLIAKRGYIRRRRGLLKKSFMPALRHSALYYLARRPREQRLARCVSKYTYDKLNSSALGKSRFFGTFRRLSSTLNRLAASTPSHIGMW